MIQESLIEMIAVSDYCINFRKDPKTWGSHGCYGYPSAVLLFSITDSIGSYILDGLTRNHFNILNHPDYYNLGLSEDDIKVIYENYRCILTHNSTMPLEHFLAIGTIESPVFEYKGENPYINLIPFLAISKKCVFNFLENADELVIKSQTLAMILKK